MSKKRLVELIREANVAYKGYADELLKNGFVIDESKENFTADFLLANGVIVPPCKVGDVVYSIRGFDGKPEQCEAYKVIDITIYENTIAIHIMDEWLFIRNMFLDDIGKTIFLSREEAEAKLKEGESK